MHKLGNELIPNFHCSYWIIIEENKGNTGMVYNVLKTVFDTQDMLSE